MVKEKPFIGLQDISPVGTRSTNDSERKRGGLSNTTGLINLWSPFYALMRPGRVDYPGPRYVEPVEGYESMLERDQYGKYVLNSQNGYNLVGYTSPYSGNTYKLQLITDKPRHRSHTIMGNVAIINDNYPQNCMINPADAAARGIEEGDMVYVYNDRGCTKIPAELTHRTPPGVIRIFHGAWYRPHPTEKVKVWLDTDLDDYGNAMTKQYSMPVDIGGCENILTLDYQNGPLDPYVGGSINVQGCLVEVSKVKPKDTEEE
jgi:anaerobic dimethyl sulfoxide reductase subunit A